MLGRQTKQFACFDGSSASTGPVGSVTNDTVMEQQEFSHDAVGAVIQMIARQRYHDAPKTQLGVLNNPSTSPKARVTYSADWFDGVGRTIGSASYGTNGGSTFSRPSTIPTRSDTVLVSTTSYLWQGSAGNYFSGRVVAGSRPVFLRL